MAKEQTMEERIAEIVIRGFKHKQEDCETCKELWVCSTVVEKCTKDRILALIAADRAGLVDALRQILYEVRVNHVNPEYRISQIAKGAIDSAFKEMGK